MHLFPDSVNCARICIWEYSNTVVMCHTSVTKTGKLVKKEIQTANSPYLTLIIRKEWDTQVDGVRTAVSSIWPVQVHELFRKKYKSYLRKRLLKNGFLPGRSHCIRMKLKDFLAVFMLLVTYLCVLQFSIYAPIWKHFSKENAWFAVNILRLHKSYVLVLSLTDIKKYDAGTENMQSHSYTYQSKFSHIFLLFSTPASCFPPIALAI